MYKHQAWSLPRLQDATQQPQTEQRNSFAKKRGMEEEADENENTKKRNIGWSGTRPDELSVVSVGSSPYQVTELPQQLQQQLHHQQSRSMYGFDSPVSAPSTPVFESEPYAHLHPPYPSTEPRLGAHPPTWAMEDVDLVRGVTTGLAASTLAHEDVSREEDGSLHKQQSYQRHQDPGLSQYHYVMGFRANCDKCQRRERGHFAHLVERPSEKA
ncbi:hypothetical protein MVEG_12421 [Podila verticillata NRRL 6337]|uniref:Uncharacterized protein n=1 Tax=Podila verticillata NRRL 6337 TaxID=1069443 RepID=A0A086TIF9_9FUNG|nr:hypothetical protein MVEG_12421 [Podila verticillata NRRL 6337]